ncbi:hypothetical protein GCM10027294_53260 [Marinactinospora endophytica]
MRATPRRHLPAVVPRALTGLPFDLSHLRDAATPLGGPIEPIDAPQPSPYDVGCFVPGVMEALKPGKDERHASTEEVPR